MSGSATNPQSIAVIGAGIIGLSCALELADRGIRVSLFDKSWPPRGASWAAAGMLAPAFEAASTPGVHPKLFELCDHSAQLWPAWSAALEARTGLNAGYCPGPSLAVAVNAAQASDLSALRSAMQGHPDAPQSCNNTYSDIEPAVGDNIHSALLLPSDGQADNRQTMAVLVACVEAHPRVSICPYEAPLQGNSGRIDHAGHDASLICAGWGTSIVKAEESGARFSLANWDPVLDDVDCYGGQMLSVAPVNGAPQMTVRCGDLYIVPKQDRIVIGATTEPGRVIDVAEPEIVAELKRRAATICPVLADAPVIEAWAGVRPGTRDHAPILGETRTPGLFVASGHYRNGILLAPITAQIIADLMVDGKTSDLAQAFSPQARLIAQV